jgi:hypothetical protein
MRYCFEQTLKTQFGSTTGRATVELKKPDSGILTKTDAKDAPGNRPDEDFRPRSISRRLRHFPNLNPGGIS